jgi:hypothetical protein
MLINSTYFVGDLNIPQTNKADVLERLNWFIEKHERTFLEQLLGYAFCKAMLDGLQAQSVDQRWVKLLQGCEYTNRRNKLTRWRGIVPSPDQSLELDVASSMAVVVGRGQTYDPLPNQNKATIPPSVLGKNFSFVQRNVGRLRSDEYSINGNELTLANWNFSNSDTYFYEVHLVSVSGNAGTVKQSMIANYVYTEWLRDQHTQTVAVGEVATKAENAVRVSPAKKIERAWNEMFDWICELLEYLVSSESLYPEWEPSHKNCALNTFWRINTFGI